jgi:hypothetical protein
VPCYHLPNGFTLYFQPSYRLEFDKLMLSQMSQAILVVSMVVFSPPFPILDWTSRPFHWMHSKIPFRRRGLRRFKFNVSIWSNCLENYLHWTFKTKARDVPTAFIQILIFSFFLLQDTFWWYFLEKFQADKESQSKLFNRVAHNYVKLLLYCKDPNLREVFLKVSYSPTYTVWYVFLFLQMYPLWFSNFEI